MKLSTLLGFLLIPILTFAQANNKIDKEIRQAFHSKERVHVLIEFYGQPQLSMDLRKMSKVGKARFMYNALTTVAQSSQKRIKSYLQSQAIPHRDFYIVNAISAVVNKSEAVHITAYPEVKRIMPDFKQENDLALDNTVISGSRPQLRAEYTYGLDMIAVPEFWEETHARGGGVVIAGQDTGYDWTHPALRPAYRGTLSDTSADHNYNWHDAIHESFDTSRANPCGYNLTAPCDDHGHGTHTMGTMIGQDVSDRIFGIAPEAEWIGCRNMEGGIGRPSTYLECFQFFLAPTDLSGENPKPKLAPDIINNSWACTLGEGCNKSNFELLEQAVNNLTNAGVLVVVSAGNEGPFCASVKTPAAIYENSFSIGAVAEDSIVARFSSRGPVTVDSSFRVKPNVVAPGVRVYSSYPGNSYRQSSGTSMAGPHVAGMAALLLSAYPTLKGKPYRIMNIIQQSAIPLLPDTLSCYTDSIPNNIWGYGLINAMTAKLYIDSMSTNSTVDYTEMDVHVYPSVTSSTIHFERDYTSEVTELHIWNSAGQLIYKESFKGASFSIHVDNFMQGTYFYRLRDSDQFYAGKFIKM